MKRPPDLIIGEPDAPYLRRWHILPRNRWVNIYVHQFLKSDDARALHDHSYLNASVILCGVYKEYFAGGRYRFRFPGNIILRRPSTPHRVELLFDIPVWTLFVTGPRVREWGFHCPSGWRHWREFTDTSEGRSTIGRGCDG